MPEPELDPVNHLEKAKWDRVLMRASTDGAFRERLISNPNETLLSCGIKQGGCWEPR